MFVYSSISRACPIILKSAKNSLFFLKRISPFVARVSGFPKILLFFAATDETDVRIKLFLKRSNEFNEIQFRNSIKSIQEVEKQNWIQFKNKNQSLHIFYFFRSIWKIQFFLHIKKFLTARKQAIITTAANLHFSLSHGTIQQTYEDDAWLS